MTNLLLSLRLDFSESLRARWFLLYSVVFGGIIVLFFLFGLTESRIRGFTGLSRLLVTYIQLAMALLPIFVLITTVRSIAGNREAGVFEYLLSLPISLAAWFWGKMLGRFIVVFLPVMIAIFVAIVWGSIQGLSVPWGHVGYYGLFLMSLTWCFLGIGFLVSSVARSPDVAQSAAFAIWLVMLVFLDLILLGFLIRESFPAELVIGITLFNPLQVFRTASMMLFDPELALLGPAAYVILDNFGQSGYVMWAWIYPALVGTLSAAIGFWFFRRNDLP